MQVLSSYLHTSVRTSGSCCQVTVFIRTGCPQSRKYSMQLLTPFLLRPLSPIPHRGEGEGGRERGRERGQCKWYSAAVQKV